MNTVGIAACHNYDGAAVKRALAEALRPCGGMGKYVRPGAAVLVKPNLLAAASPDEAVTTHPAVVKAVIELVQEAGGRAYVGDGPMKSPLPVVAKECGISAVLEQTGAQLLSIEKAVVFHTESGSLQRSFSLSAEALNMDIIINTAKLKTHNLTGITAAVKNCYGLVPGNMKKYYHLRHPLPADFAELLLDLYLAVKPTLSIVDAVVAMEGHGPRSGRPRPVGALLASADGVALDAACAELAGFSYEEICTLQAAVKRRMLVPGGGNVQVKGPLQELKPENFNKGAARGGYSFLWRYFPSLMRNMQEKRRPWPVIGSRCTNCGDCAGHCPSGVITASPARDRARIDYDGCLRCYCCLEICPAGAVQLAKKKPSRER